MSRWWVILLFAVFLVVLVTWQSDESRCVVVNALGYDGSGVVIPLHVCRIPGNGHVFLAQDRDYGPEFQGAVRSAALVFSSRYGPLPYDYLVWLDGPPIAFDGGSVGLAVYAGLLSATYGVDVSDYAFTGAISEAGDVVPVSYVQDKASAFDGPVFVPQGNCGEGLICISDVSELEHMLLSKKV